MTTNRRSGFELVVALSLAGALSGLASVVPYLNFFSGTVFAVAVSGCLAGFRLLDQRRFGFLLVVWTAAYWFAMAVSIFVEQGVHVPGTPGVGPFRPWLLAGGFVGGALVSGSLPLLLARRARADASLSTLFFSSVVGGVAGGFLALLGWTFGSSLGRAVSDLSSQVNLHWKGYLSFQDGASVRDAYCMYSIPIVWQTGMAIVVGAIVLGAIPQRRDGASEHLESEP